MFANVGGNQNRKVIRWTTESNIFLMLKIFVMIPISILAQEKLPLASLLHKPIQLTKTAES